MECATLFVPLDHTKPKGEQIGIEVSRLAAADPATSLGPLLVNFGGPGAPGLDAGLFLDVPAEVLERFDVIGFDPRGVGQSSPTLVCDPDLFKGPQAPYDPPDLKRVRGSERTRMKLVQSYVTACEQRNGDLLRHLRTTDVARDIDLIRQALGTSTINFLGYSYGTYVAQMYASMFPKRVGRFLLDGNVAPTGVGFAGDLGRPATAKAFEVNVQRFFAWAATYNVYYGLGATKEEVERRYYATLKRLTTDPVDGIGPAEWTNLFVAPVYSEDAWPLITQGWANFDDDNTTLFAEALVFAAKEVDTFAAATRAVACSDGPWPRSLSKARAQAARTARVAPFATWTLFWDVTAPCIQWPVRGTTAPVGSATAAPILFVNGTLDAPTQISEALAARRAFPRSALLAETDGANHAGATFADNPCIDPIVTAYLLEGKLPERRPGDAADVECARGLEPGPVEIATVAALVAALENLPPEVIELLPEDFQLSDGGSAVETLASALVAAWTNTRAPRLSGR